MRSLFYVEKIMRSKTKIVIENLYKESLNHHVVYVFIIQDGEIQILSNEKSDKCSCSAVYLDLSKILLERFKFEFQFFILETKVCDLSARFICEF
jgi:hypothetical protein